MKISANITTKLISVLLTAVMMFNITSVSFAQAVSLKEIREKFDKSLDLKLEKQIAVSDNTRMVNIEQRQAMQRKIAETEKEYLVRNPDVARARQIARIVTEPASDPLAVIAGIEPAQEHRIYTRGEFTTEYKNAVEAEKQRAFKALEADRTAKIAEINATALTEQANVGEEAINLWKTDSIKNLDNWLKESKTAVSQSLNKELKSIPSKYEQYLKEVEKATQEHNELVLKELHGYAQELFKLFAKNQKPIRRSLIEAAPTLLSLKYQGKSLFTAAQKAVLVRAAQQILKEDNDCNKQGKCEQQLNALSVLGLAGTAANSDEIQDFTTKYLEHPAGLSIILTGIAALLTLKEYTKINTILHEAEKRERDMSNFDILSLATHAEMWANINGSYFGNVTKHGQYPTATGEITNAWTDVALMLAKEGSKEAIQILTAHSINQCFVTSERNFDMTWKYTGISCGGLKPFVVGALLSKKVDFVGQKFESGSFKFVQGGYNPYEILRGSYLNSSGSGGTYTEEQTRYSINKNNSAKADLVAYSKELGLNYPDVFALSIANMGMGDMTMEGERDLDKVLLEAYPSIKAKLNRYAVVDGVRASAKQSRQDNKKVWVAIMQLADIAIIVWCFWDIGRLAYKGIRGLGRLGNQIFHTIQVGRTGTIAARNAYIAKNLKVFQQMKARKVAFNKFVTRIKNAAEPVVLGQRNLYTSARLPSSYIVKSPTTVDVALANTTFTAGEGLIGIDMRTAMYQSAGNANRVLDLQNVKRALTAASADARKNYVSRGFFEKYKKYGSFLAKSTAETFRSNEYFNQNQVNSALNFAAVMREEKVFSVLPKSFMENASAEGPIKFVSTNRPTGVNASGLRNMELFSDLKNGTAEALPVDVAVQGKVGWLRNIGAKIGLPVNTQPKITGVKVDELSQVLFTSKEGKDWVQLMSNQEKTLVWWKRVLNNMGAHFKVKTEGVVIGDPYAGTVIDKKLLDPDFFKMQLADASVPTVIRTADAGNMPLELKFLADRPATWGGRVWDNWTNQPLRKTLDFLRGKKSLYSGHGEVFIREGAALRPTKVTINTTYHNDGMSVILEPNNTLSLLNSYSNAFKGAHSFYIPKHQAGNFSNIARAYDNFANPLQVTINAARNKMNSLYFITALSLSAASSGLIGPIEKNYGKLSYMDKFAITVALPYAGSVLSPVISPFVKKFGAINVLKASMVTSIGSLAWPAFKGFHGFGDIHSGGDNPPIWPLLLSAGAIGVSAALTRSASNPLMQAIGGSGNLFKAMAFKNVSSFVMVAPPLIWLGFDALRSEQRVDAGGVLAVDENDKPITKKIDFSITYPFMGAVVLTALRSLHGARISSSIGAVEKYSMRTNALKDMVASTKFVVHKDTWPMILGGASAVGAEAALFNSYSMKEANRYVGKLFGAESQDQASAELASKFVPVGAVFATAVAPFILRYKAKPILKMLGGESNPAAYNRLLGLSLTTGAAGGLLLMGQDNWWQYGLGMVMVGSGFAHTTTAFLKMGTSSLKAAETARAIPALKAAGVSQSAINDFKLLGAATAVENMKAVNAPLSMQNTVLNFGKSIKTRMTSFEVLYPGIHVTMALIPLWMSGRAENIEKEQFAELGGKDSLSKVQQTEIKNNSLQSSLYIPMGVLSVSVLSGLYGGGVFKGFNLLKKIPAGTIGASRFIFGNPSFKPSFEPLPLMQPALNVDLGFGYKGGATVPQVKADIPETEEIAEPAAQPVQDEEAQQPAQITDEQTL